MEKLWPYVLPLPTESKRQHQILLSLFRSRVSIDIIRSMPLEEPAYQRVMIKKLPYSNKTIIKWLETLVSAGTLTEGMEKSKDKRVWVKWYRLTPLGKWVRLLFVPHKQIRGTAIEKLLRELFEMYLKSAFSLCRTYRIDPKTLKTVMDKLYRAEVQARNTQKLR